MDAITKAGISKTLVAKQLEHPQTWDLDLSLGLRNVLMDSWNVDAD